MKNISTTVQCKPARCALLVTLALFLPLHFSQTCRMYAQTKAKEDDKKKGETFKVQRLTQNMGLYAIGAVSPDKRFVLLIAQKPERAPNLYIMSLSDFSVRPSLTDLKWGVADPRWSPDGDSIAFAGFAETASFSDLYTLDLRTGKLVQLTSNNFSDKEPVYSPDGKRIFYTTDESPLPDAAFGILHIASVLVKGGKPAYFTEDEATTIHPGISADQKSLYLVKINDGTGRHSLWQYGLDGKPERDLTERKFARIHRYVPFAGGSQLVLWAQEEAERQDNVFILDLKSGAVRPLPEPDLPKRSPAVSPNQTLIAFISPTSRGAHLFVFNSISGALQQITHKGANTHSPVFISDDKILFGSDRDNQSEVYLVNLTAPPPDNNKKAQ